MTIAVTPAALRARLTAVTAGDPGGQGAEFALLDVREQGIFARGHILLASNAPLSRLEIDAPKVVPRRTAPVVVCDDGPASAGLAERAAAILTRHGYEDVGILDGGNAAWCAAGFALFEGIYVPSKAFGEFVEATYGTPHLSADRLAEFQKGGRDLVVLDSRPLDEFRHMSIPGGIDVPGAELVHRIRDLAPDPTTLVVVNCAGRTRSIIGAQSLINAGVANEVVALENGTMGWSLAGHELAHGAAQVPPPLSADGRAWARQASARVATRFGVRTIDRATLGRWQAAADRRTLYVCDVRSPEEYRRGHLAGSRSTPGGQLVQATDSFLGVRGARVVLVDDDGVRATMTASWLVQLGWREVAVLAGGLGDQPLETGPDRAEVLGLEPLDPGVAIDVPELAALMSGVEVRVLDLGDSRSYEAGHVPGAWFVVRSRLAANLERIPPARVTVVTSPDGVLAHLAVAELRALTGGEVRVLTGGTEAWRQAGRPLATGPEQLADQADDVVYLRPYDRTPDETEAAMRAYIAWETDLVPQLARDGTLAFKTYP